MFGRMAVTAIELEAERRRETLLSLAQRGNGTARPVDRSDPRGEASVATVIGRAIAVLAGATGRRLGRTAQRA